VAQDRDFMMEKPLEEYWKLRAFNHELSSERITIERVLGMLGRRCWILWRPIEHEISKVPTIFRVICKIHNVCMDCWMINNPAAAWLGKYPGSSPFSDDLNLWESFDITVGVDDVFEQPSDEEIIDRLQNQYARLGERRWVYAARNIPLRDSLKEELY
jgi:hypothetical protein